MKNCEILSQRSSLEIAQELYAKNPHGPVTVSCINALTIAKYKDQLRPGSLINPLNRCYLKLIIANFVPDAVIANCISAHVSPRRGPLAFRVKAPTDPKAQTRTPTGPNLTFEQALEQSEKTNGRVVPVIYNHRLIRVSPKKSASIIS